MYCIYVHTCMFQRPIVCYCMYVVCCPATVVMVPFCWLYRDWRKAMCMTQRRLWLFMKSWRRVVWFCWQTGAYVRMWGDKKVECRDRSLVHLHIHTHTHTWMERVDQTDRHGRTFEFLHLQTSYSGRTHVSDWPLEGDTGHWLCKYEGHACDRAERCHYLLRSCWGGESVTYIR